MTTVPKSSTNYNKKPCYKSEMTCKTQGKSEYDLFPVILAETI